MNVLLFPSVNTEERIQEAIRATLKSRGISQAELARKLNIKPQSLSPIVLRQRAMIPDSLIEVLDALDLELYVRPKSKSPRDDE
jgi:transcriptional regulator with XRE-family HTH domain